MNRQKNKPYKWLAEVQMSNCRGSAANKDAALIKNKSESATTGCYYTLSFYRLASQALCCLVCGITVFLWELRYRGKVRACDLICISSWSILSFHFLMPSLLSLSKNRSSHYLPSLSPSQIMSSLFSPRFFSYHFFTTLPPLPQYSTSPSVYLYPSFSKLRVSPVNPHSHSRGIHSRLCHQALLG